MLEDADREAALALLRDPALLQRLVADFNRCGVVGEDDNLLVAYLSATSRQLPKPLAVVIQSSSSAGKSSVMDAVLRFMPEESTRQYSAMTGQSLFYMGESNLKHKILAICEEEGAEQASYALKLLQSDGKVTIASTGKDDHTGQLVTKSYTVEGPVMLLMTTTALDMDEELLNRCLVLSVNESSQQTESIHQAQRGQVTMDGLAETIEKTALGRLHQNAQRLLQPVAVVNPYAPQLTFASHKTRLRRDHMKYLTLINAIAFIHQYQRQVHVLDIPEGQVRYIEVKKSDIALANRLAQNVFASTLDEIPPQTRKLLNLIYELVSAAARNLGIMMQDYRFTRKAIRTYTGWSDSQLKLHCKRLEEMEYLAICRGGHGKAFEYILLYDGEGLPSLGLKDVNTLQDVTKSNPTLKNTSYDDNRSTGCHPQVRGVSNLTFNALPEEKQSLNSPVVWPSENHVPPLSKNAHPTGSTHHSEVEHG